MTFKLSLPTGDNDVQYSALVNVDQEVGVGQHDPSGAWSAHSSSDPQSSKDTVMSSGNVYMRSGGVTGVLKEVWAFRRTFVILLTPVLLFPMIAGNLQDKALKCGYTGLIMAVYWTTEALPLAVTALLPLVLFPFLGVLTSKQVSINYLKDANVLFLAGLVVAVAIEDSNLHKRIALRVLMLVGSKPRWLMFGFMGTTAFLSMWISNTATTAMMVPIAQAVIEELEKHLQSKNNVKDHDENGDVPNLANGKPSESTLLGLVDDPNGIGSNSFEMNSFTPTKRNSSYRVSVLEDFEEMDTDSEVERSRDSRTKVVDFSRLCKGLTICICYAANIGGTATLTGTGPNMVFKGVIDSMSDNQSGITFASWMLLAFPNMIICLLICWMWLQIFFLGWRTVFNCCAKSYDDDTANQVIRKEYEKLGHWRFAEIAVLCHFIALAVLWLTRNPEFVDGWSALLEDGYVSDAAAGMLICMSLFIFPSQRPNFFCCRAKDDNTSPGPVTPLLTWKKVQQKLAWDVIILLGGGFALADGAQKSGLSSWLGEQLSVLAGIPTWAITMLISFLVAGITEFTSNISTTTVFLPIVAQVAINMNVNPLLFMIGATISASFAFMLPVATPPNAIVFAYGHLKVLDMVFAGFPMNLVCILALQLAINSWGHALLHLGDFPAWAMTDGINSTTTVVYNTTL